MKMIVYPPGWEKPMVAWDTASQVALLHGHGKFTLKVDVSWERVEVPVIGSHRIVAKPGREIWTVTAHGGALRPGHRIWHPATEQDAQRLVEILAKALPDIWDIETPRTLPGWMLVRLAGESKRWKGYAAA